jgi:hypothetical protein
MQASCRHEYDAARAFNQKAQHWRLIMKKPGIYFFLLVALIFLACQQSEAKSKNYYRTFEIIAIGENSLTLKDSDGNVIEVEKDPADYKVGYKVRYDSVRQRLRPSRWQDYEVISVTGDTTTLLHKTGDSISVKGNYTGKYDIGDMVRYDSVDNKLQLAEDSGQWQQYRVVEASPDKITLQDNYGQQIILHMDNNIYLAPRGLYIGKYKVGDLVRYNAATNKLKKGQIRTYDWQKYEVKEVTQEQVILLNKNKEELILENTYGTQFKAGDPVKYDRLNNLLKKVR